MKTLATTSTTIPTIFNTDSTDSSTDDLIVSESKLYPFAAFNRCQRSCSSIKEKKLPILQETASTTTCGADGILSSLKSIFKPRLSIRQTPPDDTIVGYALTDRMKQPYFGLLNPHHSTSHHHEHSYPHNQHSPEYYQQQNNNGPLVYNHPMPRRYARHCNQYCPNTILSYDKCSSIKYPKNPLFNYQDISRGRQMASKIFNSRFRPTRFFKKYTNVQVTPPIIGTVSKVDKQGESK